MMKSIHLIAVSVLITIIISGCSNNPTQGGDQSSQGTVTGKVISSESALLSSAVIPGQAKPLDAAAAGVVPVPGAVCAIEGTDKKDITDENGVFKINGVSYGSHILICRKTLADGNSYSFLHAIEVSNSGTIDIGTLELTMGGKIQGAAVMQGRTDQSGIKVFIPGTSYQAQTDSAGSYQIKNVPAGTYALKFEHAGFRTAMLDGIVVTAGGITSAVDITLTADTGPTGTLSINGGDTYSRSRTVMLSIAASADALLMMISEDPAFVGAAWQAVAASQSHTLASDGQKRIYLKFANENGLESGAVSDEITVDTAAPSGAALIINDSAAEVNTTNATLTLFAADAGSGVHQMMIGNDAGFTGSAWEPFSGTRAWTLPGGDGTKTVYAKFKDAAGNETEAVSDSILLNTGGPGAGGTIDTGFGTNGKVYMHVGNVSAFLFSVAVQPDGKIVAGGYAYVGNVPQFLAVRFNSDGSLDTSFGGSGMVSTSFSSSGSSIAALAIQADGKIVAAGNAPSGFGVVRYNSDGSLDTAFGTSGKTTVSVGSYPGCNALGLQSDGKIVLAGYAWGTDNDMVVVRLTMDGGLDATFNGTGMVKTNFGTNHDQAYALVIQGDDKIVAGGYADTAQGRNFGLLRYNGDGSLDPTFGTGGKVTTAFGSSQINTLGIQADGKIVAAGRLATAELGGNYWVVAVARYNTDGSLDTSFGGTGTITKAAGNWRSEAKGVQILPSGKIILSGYTGTTTRPTDFLLIQYNSDGSPDMNFGTNGVVITDIAGDADTSNAIAVQPDGKIIAAGNAFFESATGIALVRYQ